MRVLVFFREPQNEVDKNNDAGGRGMRERMTESREQRACRRITEESI